VRDSDAGDTGHVYTGEGVTSDALPTDSTREQYAGGREGGPTSYVTRRYAV